MLSQKKKIMSVSVKVKITSILHVTYKTLQIWPSIKLSPEKVSPLIQSSKMAIFKVFCIWLHVTIKIRRYKWLWKITKSVLTNLSSWMGLWADTVQRTLIIKQHGTWKTWRLEYFSSVRCSGSEYWCSLRSRGFVPTYTTGRCFSLYV